MIKLNNDRINIKINDIIRIHMNLIHANLNLDSILKFNFLIQNIIKLY